MQHGSDVLGLTDEVSLLVRPDTNPVVKDGGTVLLQESGHGGSLLDRHTVL